MYEYNSLGFNVTATPAMRKKIPENKSRSRIRTRGQSNVAKATRNASNIPYFTVAKPLHS